MRYLMMWLAAVCAAVFPAFAQGQLVIVGGGLSDDNEAVFAAFLDALPSPDAPIAIIPAASAEPARSAATFAAQLERRGVAAERIRIIRLASVDDPASSEDESAWAANGEAPGEIMKLAGVGGIWFTGGDQARIMAGLTRGGEEPTAMLEIIRQRFAAGAVIGGTSAGAAIMTNRMIVQGDPFSLLPGQSEAREPLVMGRGLGLLKQGLVDQHFGERARLIRLVAALAQTDGYDPIGFGIDEDTALVVAPDQLGARAVGRGRVTVIDARGADFFREPPLDVRRARIASFTGGETINLSEPTARAPVRPDSEAALPACIAAPSGAGLAPSESQWIAQLAGQLGEGEETTCLMAAGREGLALRFYRSAMIGAGSLMLDILPVKAEVELRQR
ncbi:MAG: cyanophycinase [Erythrobacter sp. SCN 62-14]|nr:MAG: cyanophycinase [Erythrobacter sp. SCN 62-14]